VLTLVEAISLAGDRTKQNDDAHGARNPFAWVIDGATDLHDKPERRFASDAAWLATQLNKGLYSGLHHPSGLLEEDLRHRVAFESRMIEKTWSYKREHDVPRWKLPTASVLIVSDANGSKLQGLDLGDCRCFVLDASDASHTLGGHDGDDESKAAADAVKRTGGGAPLRDAQTLDLLRSKRAEHNREGGYWVFGLQPECADHARYWSLSPPRPAHILLCTDGFSALVDRYHAYDAASLVRAALDKGLQELGRELRAIEAADASGAKHPRFKPSDDATAVLLRLS
jgi:serine/threonine protein phosphatase PrpC